MKGEKKNTATMVRELVLPIVEQQGLRLWDVRFEKEGASWFLRVIIDSEQGISLDHCEAVSRPLSDLLDEKDFISQSYYLEVSSPGLLRELKRQEHFEMCLNQDIWVHLIRPRDNRRDYLGVLTSLEEETFTMTTLEDGEEIRFARKDCAYVKLYDDKDIVPFA